MHKSLIGDSTLYRSSSWIGLEIVTLLMAYITIFVSFVMMIRFLWRRDYQALLKVLIIFCLSLVAIIIASVIDMETLVYAT